MLRKMPNTGMGGDEHTSASLHCTMLGPILPYRGRSTLQYARVGVSGMILGHCFTTRQSITKLATFRTVQRTQNVPGTAMQLRLFLRNHKSQAVGSGLKI